MKKLNYYINGVGIISPQRTFNNAEFLTEITSYTDNKLSCVLPEFKDYINPIQLRRLSRMLRAGLSSAVICLHDSGDIQPDGIITATGYGFLNDTAKFLNEIIDFNEKQLTPTYFMQGTYNALAGLVALTLKCKGYNNTYVTRGFAFETSLHDALMQLQSDPLKTFLVGSVDERDEAQYNIHSRVDYYKKEKINNLELYEHKTVGSLQGEGASFISISGTKSSNAWAQLKDLKMIHRPDSKEVLLNSLNKFLNDNNTSLDEINVLVNGISGDVIKDQLLNDLVKDNLSKLTEVRFKHLCGEYCTATSFGLWLAASIIKKQVIPNAVKFNEVDTHHSIKNVLMINQYMGKNYSFILLAKD